MNLGTLMTGTSEPQVERQVRGRYAAVLAGGYTYKAVRVGCLVDDNTTLDRMRGGFVKAGVKARWFCLRKSCNQMHVQLNYVASLYDEQGTVGRDLDEGFERIAVARSGIAHGVAASAYWDLGLYRALRLRLGMQLGRYWRTDNFGMPCQNCQPGFGVTIPILPTQAIMGMAYNIGVSD